MKCSRVLSLVLLFAIALSLGASDAEESPKSVIEDFYALCRSVGPHGVPERASLPKFRLYVSDRLFKLLSDASAAEEQYREKTKNEVPPLVEGDLFSSLAEGPKSVKVESCVPKGTKGACTVAFTYADPDGKNTVRWSDKVYVVKGPIGWAVDDIEYMAPWAYGNRGRLQQILKRVVKEAKEF
jgi:hypothetical protein